MKIFFVRHGESEANLLQEFSNRGLKHGLTPTGVQQATALAAALGPLQVTKMYSSPLLRARQTADILATTWRVSWELADALCEYDCGVLEGKSDAASWAIYHAVFADWTEHRLWERRIDGGESFLDIKARFMPFIERLIGEYGRSPDCLVLIGHGGTYHCMLPLVLDNVDFAFATAHPISNTGYIAAELQHGRLVCTAWCEVAMPPLAL